MSQEETYVRLFYGGMSLLVPMSFVLNAHPGGAEYILQYANQDITTAFADMNHSADAEALLQTFEEKEDKRGCVLYNPEQGTATTAELDGFTAESRRLSEVRWWRRRQWCAMTAATVAAAAVVAAFALRRGSVQHS